MKRRNVLSITSVSCKVHMKCGVFCSAIAFSSSGVSVNQSIMFVLNGIGNIYTGYLLSWTISCAEHVTASLLLLHARAVYRPVSLSAQCLTFS